MKHNINIISACSEIINFRLLQLKLKNAQMDQDEPQDMILI